MTRQVSAVRPVTLRDQLVKLSGGVIEANQAANIYGSTVFNYSSFTVACS